MDIFQLATKERAINKQQLQEDERTILVVGSKQGGKSTLLYQFLDRTDEAPKPTLALEYAFGRKSRTQDMGKDVVHIWELGGGTSLSTLVDTPVTTQALRSLSVVMVLDVSVPSAIWPTFHALIGEVRARIDKVMSDLKSKDSKIPAYLKKKSWDKDFIDPLVVPFVMLATKYDKFQDLEPEQRKILTKSLRFLAHTHGASLFFTSNKDEAAMSRCRSVLNMLAFKAGALPRGLLIDPAKPLVVPVGADSLTQIGAPPVIKDSGVELRRPEDLWRVSFQHYFPAVMADRSVAAAGVPADPSAAPKYADSVLDALRAHKEEELERYRRQAERRAREQSRAVSDVGGDDAASAAEDARTPHGKKAAGGTAPATPTSTARSAAPAERSTSSSRSSSSTRKS